MKQFIFFLVLAAALGYAVNTFVTKLPQVASTQTVEASVTLPDHVLRGGNTFNQFCQHCHEFERGGRPDDVMDLSYYRGDLSELKEMLSSGKGDMPTFDGMFEEIELQELHAYLTY